MPNTIGGPPALRLHGYGPTGTRVGNIASAELPADSKRPQMEFSIGGRPGSAGNLWRFMAVMRGPDRRLELPLNRTEMVPRSPRPAARGLAVASLHRLSQVPARANRFSSRSRRSPTAGWRGTIPQSRGCRARRCSPDISWPDQFSGQAG